VSIHFHRPVGLRALAKSELTLPLIVKIIFVVQEDEGCTTCSEMKIMRRCWAKSDVFTQLAIS